MNAPVPGGDLDLHGLAQVVTGNGGLPKVRVTTGQCTGEVYLHGAHVTSWKPVGAEEVFFLSRNSRWQGGSAIRGGVPICFPWFGDKADDPKAPAHGFVRTREWEIEAVVQSGKAITVSMFTASDESSQAWAPGSFRAVYRATFGAELDLELAVINTGARPLRFEEALHAYYDVGDVTQARIAGLDSVEYLDKTDAFRAKQQRGDVTISAETDRVYLNTEAALELRDPVLRRRIHVGKENSRTTVIWNPWVQKGQALSDLGADQWRRMVCIEVSNVGAFAVQLAPGEAHRMATTIQIAPL